MIQEVYPIIKGQIYQNQDLKRFIVLDVNDKEVKLQCMDETDQYFPNEVIICSLDSFKIQQKNLNVISTLEFDRELELSLHLKRLVSDINNYHKQISTLEDKIKDTKIEIKKFLKELYNINPSAHPVTDISGEYMTEEQISMVFEKQIKERQERINKTIAEATEWFEITCPHCGSFYTCTPNGLGTHAFDYLTKDGVSIEGDLWTGELQCPNCKKWAKEEEWDRIEK